MTLAKSHNPSWAPWIGKAKSAVFAGAHAGRLPKLPWDQELRA